MAVVYSDSFTGTTVNPFWNSTQGCTQGGGQLTIAAGGNYLGATGVSQAVYREVVFQVVSGDRPGVKLYWDGGEVLSVTAHSGTIDVYHHGTSVGTWTYTATNTWWKLRWDGLRLQMWTSADGSSWTLAGEVSDNENGAINALFVNSAGNGIGTGTSRLPTVVDSFLWQDFDPPAISLASPTLDDCQRADEDPLSNGGLWDSPGLVDGHTPLELVSRRIVGTSDVASALIRTPYGPGMEAWATLAATNPSRGEPTVFLAMDADPKNGYVFWTDSVSEYYVGRFDAGAFTGLQPVLPTPGGNMQAGDRIGLVVEGGLVTAAISRSGGAWRVLTQLADSAYDTGLIGLGCVNGVSYSAYGGGNRPRAGGGMLGMVL